MRVIRELPTWATNCVYSDWLHSYVKRAGEFSRSRFQQGRHEAYKLQHARIDDLLPVAPIKLALLDLESPSWIGGWLVASPMPNALWLHYVYVKRGLQQNGYGSAMLAEALRLAGDPDNLYATHLLERWLPQMAKLGMVYQPLTKEVREGRAKPQQAPHVLVKASVREVA